MQTLDEHGFVFIDSENRPFWVRLWGGKPWLFYWHPDKKWVSLCQVNQSEIWSFSLRSISPDEAAVYHRLHWQKQEYAVSDSDKKECDGPNCNNQIGALLRVGVAVTGDALGNAAFCCECCAEEWLDAAQVGAITPGKTPLVW